MPNFDEISQFTAEIKLLPVLKNGRPPYWNSISGFDFDLCRHVILHLPAKFRSNRTIVDGVMTSYRFFKMAAIESEMYFRVQVYWRYLFKKVEMYQHAKF